MARHYSDARKNAYRTAEAKRRELTTRKREGTRAKVETRVRFAIPERNVNHSPGYYR